MNTKAVIESRKMKTSIAPVFAIAAALIVGAGSAYASPLAAAANHDTVIAVSTSLDGSPSEVMSPAASAAPANTSRGLGLFEQESPTPLIAMALLLGAARVGKVLIDRRRRVRLSRAGGGRARRLPGSRSTAAPFLIGDGAA